MLQQVAVLFHPERERAVAEAEWLRGELERRGIQVVSGNGWNDETVVNLGCGKDLAVAIGGDGTIIHVARCLASCGTTLLGVNLGTVGFLAEITPERLHERVADLAAGDYWIEERSMLDVEWQGDSIERFLALNEVAVARGLSPQAIHIKTSLDGLQFMTYTADAVLVATATGSTAYSLAAGGPILYPTSRDFMLTPVAPHLHIGRSIIVPGTTKVTLTLSSDRAAVVSVDGSEDRILEPHHQVHVQRSETVTRFARMGSCEYFYQAIASRLR